MSTFEANFRPEDLRRDMMAAVDQELRSVAKDMEAAISDEIEEKGISESGDLAGTIGSGLKEIRTHFLLTVGPTKKYGEYVFHGTKPHWPPRKAIRRWVRKKLQIGPGEMMQKEVAFNAQGQDVRFTAQVNKLEQVTRAVMHKIATQGTEGQDYLSNTFNRFVDEIPERISDAANTALAG